MVKKGIAEFIGTFWLVFGGCGSAIFAAAYPELGIGFTGVSIAFGLTVVTMAYSIGHISGAHLNPAVTIGLWAGGRVKSSDVFPYIISQVCGGLFAGAMLYVIASGNSAFSLEGGFASNGYGEHSPNGYNMMSAFLIEFVLTFVFLIIIIGSTDKLAPSGFAGLAIGLGLILIHLISIPITNTSVNPARSTSQAIFAGGWAIQQLWLFWLAPILGAIAAGLVYKNVFEKTDK